MSTSKQIASSINKQLSKSTFLETAQQLQVLNEAQTRTLLIEPFLEILGYGRDKGLIPEYNADFGASSRKKVDYAITIRSSDPIIIIEAKKFNETLSDRHAGQLNGYFSNIPSAQIGILTNGVSYKFYVGSTIKQNILHPEPFLEFDISDYSNSELEALVKFHRSCIEPSALVQESDEKILFDLFQKSLYEELKSPSDDLLKLLLKRIDPSYRLTSSRKQLLSSFINPFSIKDVADKFYDEVIDGNRGVFTTDEEIKAYHFIKALLIQDKKIDANRISYEDLKTKFNIIVDGKKRSIICSLHFSSSNLNITISDVAHTLENIEDIVRYKKFLLDSAKRELEI